MPEYISKDVAFQRLLCKESEFNHWNDYNLAQYIIAQIVPEDVVPATHIQKLGNIVQTIKNGRACRNFSCCGTDCTEMTSWMWPKYCPWCGAKLNGGVCNA